MYHQESSADRRPTQQDPLLVGDLKTRSPGGDPVKEIYEEQNSTRDNVIRGDD
jgi:hypothetical protein